MIPGERLGRSALLLECENRFSHDLAGLERAVGVHSLFERERRADHNPQITAVEVSRRPFENSPLALSMLRPSEHRWRRHPGERDAQIPVVHRCDGFVFPWAFDGRDQVAIRAHQRKTRGERFVPDGVVNYVSAVLPVQARSFSPTFSRR